MYAELHCHTNYSFQDGASWAEQLVGRAVELDYTALAVTDHDGFRGAVRFHQAASAAGLPAVYGTEVGLRPDVDIDLDINSEPIPGPDSVAPPPESRRGRTHPMHGSKPMAKVDSEHLVLLASSPEGYGAISHLVSKAQFRGRKDRPVYDWDDLAEAATVG